MPRPATASPPSSTLTGAPMEREIAAATLAHLLETGSTLALIDVREHGEYNLAHIPGASSLPRRQLETRMGRLVPLPRARARGARRRGRPPAARGRAARPRRAHAGGIPALLHPRRPQRAGRRAGAQD